MTRKQLEKLRKNPNIEILVENDKWVFFVFNHAIYDEPIEEDEHVCGLQGFGALDDVCPACEYEASERKTTNN